MISCSPKGGYKVLSFFFDGVSDSLQKNSIRKDTLTADSLATLTGQSSNDKPGYFYHSPYYKQQCNACHDPSARSKIIQPQPGVCYQCHENDQQKYTYTHGPVAGGYCTECHSPHLSQYSKLLTRTGKALCTECHDESYIMKTQAHKEIDESVCTDCHSPHGSVRKFLLRN